MITKVLIVKVEEGAKYQNIFFFSNKNILVIKGLDQKDILDMKAYPLFLNDVFVVHITFLSEYFIENKTKNIDERAFECTQNLNQLKNIDLNVSILKLDIG